jgi:transposase
MAFVGLVPGEHSSGSKRKLTGITKAGSVVARRLIVESAWAYRMPAKIGQAMNSNRSPFRSEKSRGRRRSDCAADIGAC